MTGADEGNDAVAYEVTDHYRATRDFPNHRERYVEKLGRRGSGDEPRRVTLFPPVRHAGVTPPGE